MTFRAPRIDTDTFESIVSEAFLAVPQRFRSRVKNLALLVEDEPDAETKREEGLKGEETLLGLYRGIPNTERGSDYGVGVVLPDTITVYRLPTLEEAYERAMDTGHHVTATSEVYLHEIREVVRETIWHEIAHYFGMDEHDVGGREEEGSNRY